MKCLICKDTIKNNNNYFLIYYIINGNYLSFYKIHPECIKETAGDLYYFVHNDPGIKNDICFNCELLIDKETIFLEYRKNLNHFNHYQSFKYIKKFHPDCFLSIAGEEIYGEIIEAAKKTLEKKKIHC